MPARRVSTTRRGALSGALSGALGLVLLTACDVDDLRPPEAETTPLPSPTPGATETPAPDADTALVERVHLEVAAAVGVVEGARSFPRLRASLQPVLQMHRAHLEVLPPLDQVATPPPAAPSSPAEALERVRAAEQELQQSLVGAAVEARSGALARLLASMSASVSQHLAVLPTARTAPTAAEGQP